MSKMIIAILNSDDAPNSNSAIDESKVFCDKTVYNRWISARGQCNHPYRR